MTWTTPAILLATLAIDAVIGDPAWLWTRLPHPIRLIGSLIAWLDRRLNHEAASFGRRRLAGIVAAVILAAIVITVATIVEVVLRQVAGGVVVVAFVASVFLAQRSLYDHVAAVRDALATGGVEAGRNTVSMIVGRETRDLDEAGIARAAIESCAENFSDGVIAPAFWFALFGLPGLVFYKASNTADSMIGHRSPRYHAFGWAAARLDDLLNLVPARLAGLLIALVAPTAGGAIGPALATMGREAGLHRSPNAGWPESAMAAALGLALAGPRRYGAEVVEAPLFNKDGRLDAGAADIGRALRVMVAAGLLHAALYGGVALALQ